jgi:radical SAM superfamily enzyme YgiQ (UPF0313 family)
MKLTMIHPCIGRRINEPYIRTWQMEPLAPAVLAALTPPDVAITFADDRLEPIPYDAPTDLVAISIETYTAKRAYQIAARYRQRGVPVVMGGFHATLVPEEVALFADSVIVGAAEQVWAQVLEDARAGRLQPRYRASAEPAERHALPPIRTDRSIFAGKRYLPIGLVEAGRGCQFSCEFCAVHSFYGPHRRWRDPAEVAAEVAEIRAHKRLIFFVDDNISGHRDYAKALFRALIPLRIRWVSQASINIAHDEEMLALMRASGCQGVLIGFESLNAENLAQMGKRVNQLPGGYDAALATLRRYGMRLYATFVVGYDHDTPDAFGAMVEFTMRHRFFIAAFNHLTPFPGTPLYQRLADEGRLPYGRWWLHPEYRYGMVPFTPRGMSAEQIRDGCIAARREVYRLAAIARRGSDWRVNCDGPAMLTNFALINWLIRREVGQRIDYPLGDEGDEMPDFHAIVQQADIRHEPALPI